MAKSKYETYVLPRFVEIEGWARDGLTDEQIAKNLGISKVSLYKYIDIHHELFELLKKNKSIVDREVENALLKRALGYEYEEVTKEQVLNPDTGKFELKTTKVVTKQVAPDNTAQIFWLKNRKPAEWRDKKDIDANVQQQVVFTDESELED